MWIAAPEIANRQSQIANWVTGNLATRYKFTGREFDDFTGLHYYRARWYDGNLGRFISEDPIGFAAGDVNLYGYVGNKPVSYSDPFGLDEYAMMERFANQESTNRSTDEILDDLQFRLATAGNTPFFGEPLDLIDGMISLFRGDYYGAGMSIPSMVPFLGTGAGISKSCYRLRKLSTRIPWGSWDDYPKVIVNGDELAVVGNRLYKRHAVDRMQPSGNRFRTGGQDGGMPQIRQTGEDYDYGRGVAPQYVEDAISSSNGIPQPNGNISHTSGTLQIILNPQGHVVTIITH